MKVLVIPDCHLKPWMFAQADAIVKKGIADKAVCLMDLADDFGVHGDAQYPPHSFSCPTQLCAVGSSL